MGWATDLGEVLLRCDVASGPRLLVILLGAIASAVTITLTSHTLYRRLVGPSGPVRRAAEALRAEGENRAAQRDWRRALELYNLSILMNPRAAQAYYLRGLIKEQRGEMNRAIADWKRCRDRHPTHFGAREKLLHFEPTASRAPKLASRLRRGGSGGTDRVDWVLGRSPCTGRRQRITCGTCSRPERLTVDYRPRPRKHCTDATERVSCRWGWAGRLLATR
jgi:hypothetical protein